MPKQTTMLLVALLASTVPAIAADEGPESHAERPQKVVAMGAARLSPPSLRMGTGDVLTFQNFSGRVMKITFIEPKNPGQHVKCEQVKRISENEAIVAGALFKRRGDQVVAYVAPGAFVSLCSLGPGRYVYVATPTATTGATAATEALGQKGEIIVE